MICLRASPEAYDQTRDFAIHDRSDAKEIIDKATDNNCSSGSLLFKDNHGNYACLANCDAGSIVVKDSHGNFTCTDPAVTGQPLVVKTARVQGISNAQGTGLEDVIKHALTVLVNNGQYSQADAARIGLDCIAPLHPPANPHESTTHYDNHFPPGYHGTACNKWLCRGLFGAGAALVYTPHRCNSVGTGVCDPATHTLPLVDISCLYPLSAFQ